MNCKEIRELILTDYLDKELDSKKEQEISSHLSQCNACKEYASKALESTIKPFKGVERAKCPESVWFQIKGKIATEGMQRVKAGSMVNLLDKPKRFFEARRPVLMAATALIALFILLALPKLYLNRQEIVKRNQEKQAEYLLYFVGEGGYVTIGENGGYGTEIEQYFL